MIFQKEHCKLIAQSKKTQTRRLVQESDFLLKKFGDISYSAVYRNRKLKWRTGKEYTVQSGRGKYCLVYCKECKTVFESDEQGWYWKIGQVGFTTNRCPVCGWAKYTNEDGYERIEAPFEPLKIRITKIRKEKLLDITLEERRI